MIAWSISDTDPISIYACAGIGKHTIAIIETMNSKKGLIYLLYLISEGLTGCEINIFF